MEYQETPFKPDEEKKKEAMQQFCDDFYAALDLVIELKNNYSDELNDRAKEWNSSLYMRSFQGGLFYPLKVTIGKDITAHSSEYNQIIEEGLRDFTTTDLREVAVDKVVFFNFPHGPWHVVFGHDIQIEPIYDSEQ